MTTKRTLKAKRLPSDEHKLLVEAHRDPEVSALSRPIDKLHAKGYIRFVFNVAKMTGGWELTEAATDYLREHGLIEDTAQCDTPDAPVIPQPLSEIDALKEQIKNLEWTLRQITTYTPDTEPDAMSEAYSAWTIRQIAELALGVHSAVQS